MEVTDKLDGVLIELTWDEVAKAIDLYVYSRDIVVRGPRTVRVNGGESGSVYVHAPGFVIADGKRWP
ncbi:MAG: hypothetical protein OQK82_01340 [Candidatus Pacearchaeota archaeon]|nr:hypothetical protein [Candidatus Pacearchaeota archaeon]